MKGSSGLNSLMLKRKNSNSKKQEVSNEHINQMNKTSLQSLSSTSSLKSQEKLSQLKQKLEKERQNMRKTGRRFKQNSSEISIQTVQQQQQSKSETLKPLSVCQKQSSKPSTSKLLLKSSKKSTGVGISTNTATNLYDFNTIKAQVQLKSNKMFAKKINSAKNDPIIPTYTTQQILNNPNIGLIDRNKNMTNNRSSNVQLKRQTIDLMELSTVLTSKSPQKSLNKKSTSKQKSSFEDTKFIDPSKLKKSSSQKQNNSQKQILTNSHVFQQAIKQQKKRNMQVHQFLSRADLESFTDSFINMGFDQIQTLIEVQVDDLNQVMMRAKQQQKLMNLIKKYKEQNKIESQLTRPLVDRPSEIHSRVGYRPKSAALTTEPSESNQILAIQSSRMRSTTNNFNMKQSTLVSKSSIFYSMGGSQWSLESQIRKACSGCFKVSYDAVKRGQCYYCQNCDPGQFDCLQISLDESMIRNCN